MAGIGPNTAPTVSRSTQATLTFASTATVAAATPCEPFGCPDTARLRERKTETASPNRALSPRQPSPTSFAVDVAELDATHRDFDVAEYDRQLKASWTDRSGVEHADATIATDERHVRVPAHDQPRALA